jgi:hypothetical protein
MGNWQEEAARFAPGLRVLLLQGKDRMGQFDQIDEADLVLTTYALLPRDEEKLREHDFHLVILDESHYIKNTRSKAAQSAGLLKARHRLCLSGTPLENHLGELWSQFHFLLPGLLGDEKRLQHRVPPSDRAPGRSAAARAAEPPHQAFPAAPDQGQRGQGTAAEDGNGAQGRADGRPARPVRNRAPGDGPEGARGNRPQGRGAQPDRDPGGAAQAAPGVLRPAPGEVAAVQEADGRLGQADRPDADGRGFAGRRPQDPGVLAVHQHAGTDRGELERATSRTRC